MEVDTNEKGEFTAVLGDKQGYNGGPFEVHFLCSHISRQALESNPPTPLQFSVVTLQPPWRRGETGLETRWEHCLSPQQWSLVRAKFDAWVVCGRVLVGETQLPVPKVKVTAIDVDWVHDDPLGAAMTDGVGFFRIDYGSAAFKKDSLGLNIELVGGPDIYFKIETPAGDVLLAEPSSRGREPDRENRGPCCAVNLFVQK